MFEHLKELEVHGTSWLDLPEVSPTARVQLKPASEANKPYFNELLKRGVKRARAARRGEGITAKELEENRLEDREAFPSHVLVGWDGIEDTSGQPVPFSKEAAREFCAQLPSWIFDRIRDAAQTPERFVATRNGHATPPATDEEVQAVAKNSSSGSAGS